ncbi:TPA: hypothetical protein I7730_01420 [Vibrio vulnificus]|uniref:Exonuclease domain-containing protein n=1 Tax=Vibrio vulnificus TaxID=672 RepID=A0A8H9MY90_VIBVL|nr:hypothetical protein [Vibrio vulnificus]HAS8538456.1 hypothetical protein [Vibrio vulnificus]
MVIIDIEASGLGVNSFPIEIAWKDPNTNEYESFLIDPTSVDYWDDWDHNAACVHGISFEELALNGIHPIEAAQRLNSQLCGSIAYSDGFGTDTMWLSVLYEAVGIEPTFELRCLYTYMVNNKLSVPLFKSQMLSSKTPHRALPDVEKIVESANISLGVLWASHCEWDLGI